MNTASNDLSRRKTQHLDICLNRETHQVESGDTCFNGIHFYHRALPELDRNQIDTGTKVLDFQARAPIFISCMTGGSEEGYRLNKDLARAAEELRIPVGMGSNRILWKKPETLEHFQFRKYAPTVPILSNIGAVQVRDMEHTELIEMNKRLEVSAQVIHCNPGQELFQPEGDRDFTGIKESIFRFIEDSPHPVIVKETGFGIHPQEIREFLDNGAYAVDLAGSGGTNWISVESLRNSESELTRSQEFTGWGHPTALLLAALPPQSGIWASGGVRNGLDIAKSLALGAEMAGLALPFVRAVRDSGTEGVISLFEDLEKTLKDIMFLTGSTNLKDLRHTPLWFEPVFQDRLEQYKNPVRRV